MPPKASAEVFLVTSGTAIDAVFASLESAKRHVAAAKDEGTTLTISTHALVGGTVNVVEAPAGAQKKSANAKAKAQKDEESGAQPAKKATKSVADQRAENPKQSEKPQEDDLPDNFKALLAGSGSVLNGMTVVVTGVPPILGRKKAEDLIRAYGAHLTKSLSKKTSFVVVGNDAGPTKLEKIEELGLKTYDEQTLIEMIEAEGKSAGTKRGASDVGEHEDDVDEKQIIEEEQNTKRKPKKSKR